MLKPLKRSPLIENPPGTYRTDLFSLYLCFQEAVLWRCSAKKACNFIKKGSLAQVFSCKFCKMFKNSYFYRTSLVATFGFSISLICQKPLSLWEIWICIFQKTYFRYTHLLTPFRMGIFGAAQGWRGWGGVAKRPSSLKSCTDILQWRNLAQLYLT